MVQLEIFPGKNAIRYGSDDETVESRTVDSFSPLPFLANEETCPLYLDL